MKKSLFILAAALAVCYSCSNDETVEVNKGNAISFRPVVNKMTRAADANLTTTGFRVTATKTADATKVYFRNVDFTSSTPATTFTSATKYYWPSSYNLDFFAYAPISTELVGEADKQIIPWETTTPGYDANSFTTFKVTPATAAAEQVDFVYANTDAWGKIDQDPTNAGTHTHFIDGTPEGVTINFRHTESKVAIKLYNSNSSNITVLVRDVSICNINTVGVFTYDDSGNTDTQNTTTTAADGNIFAQSLWTPSTPGFYTQTVASAENEDDFNVASATQFGEDWILIPQSLTYATAYDNTKSTPYPFAGACLKIRLQIKNAGGESEFIVGGTASTGGADSDGYVTALWPLSAPAGGWIPGTKYTYTVDLAGGGYWENNETGDQALDPILAGAEIKFVTVTVDTWDEVDGSVYTGATPSTPVVP